jgi:hypothetical protein
VTADHPTDELPGLVLGERPEGGIDPVREHLEICPSCRDDLAAIRAVSSALREAASVTFPEPGELPRLEPAAPGPDPIAVSPPRAARRFSKRTVGLAAALVVLVALIGGITSFQRERIGDNGREETVALAPIGGGRAQAALKVQTSPTGRVVTLTSSGLPDPGPDGFYQVWLMNSAGQAAVPLGVLGSDGRGIWSVPSTMAQHYAGGQFDVSLERDDGNPAHSTVSVLRGRFPA